MAESQIESQPTEQHREAAPAEPQHVEEVMESSEAAAVPPQTGKGRGKLPQLNSTSSAAFASSLLTFTILTVPKLIIRARSRSRKSKAAKAQASKTTPVKVAATEQQQASSPEAPFSFGSPCATHTPSTPAATPTVNRKTQAQDSDCDVTPSRSDQSPSSKESSTDTLKQQLKLLAQMQEENSKLRAFFEQHVTGSNKAVALESENQALKSTKQALEQELAELRKPAVPAFELNNGDELERFKRALPGGNAHYAPTHAHSVCSDANGAGATPSENGAPSVAATDMAAMRAKQSGITDYLPKWMRSSSSTTGPRGAGVPPLPLKTTSGSRAESLRSEKLAAPPTTPRGMTPAKSNTDLTSLLDSWSGTPQMVL